MAAFSKSVVLFLKSILVIRNKSVCDELFSRCKIMKKCHLIRAQSTVPGKIARLDSDVEEQYKNKKITRQNKHPGDRKLKIVELPDALRIAAINLLKDCYGKPFTNDALKLKHFLKHRVLALTDDQIRIKGQEIAEELDRKEKIVNVDLLGEIDRTKFENKRRAKILNKLRENIYNWKPMEYNSYKGLLYLYERFAPNYAANIKVFNEIMLTYPNFSPQTVFDLGSGIGSTIWSANTVWGNTLKEYFCVDTSADMNTLSQLLLQGGDENREMSIKHVFHRQFMPVSTALKYDLTICSYSLLEMRSTEERVQAIDTLWRKTSDMMVIVEKGTMAGFATVLEARDYILEKVQFSVDESAHVVAPCPHERMCPKYAKQSQIPCGFPVRYIKFSMETEKTQEQEIFCYVVLKKGKRINEGKSWPRLVSPVLPRTRHVICRMCSNDGELNEIILTKKKHNDLYKIARLSNWGDLFPIEIVIQSPDEDLPIQNDETKDEIDENSKTVNSTKIE